MKKLQPYVVELTRVKSQTALVNVMATSMEGAQAAAEIATRRKAVDWKDDLIVGPPITILIREKNA